MLPRKFLSSRLKGLHNTDFSYRMRKNPEKTKKINSWRKNSVWAYSGLLTRISSYLRRKKSWKGKGEKNE